MNSRKSLIIVVAISALLLSSACHFETKYIEKNLEFSLDSGIQGADSDCSRPNPYLYIEPIRDDMDLDSMDDSWELWNQLDPENPNDAELDVDGDGYSNLEEYQADTDPNAARYNPGVIEVTTLGFDCFYTAEMGHINDDQLLDILIRDPIEGYLPVVRDFVMIQQQDHSFVLEDAGNYEIPELTSIQSALVLANLNGDTSQDIALLGLSNYIPEVNDQIVFSAAGEVIGRGIHLDVIPFRHKDLDSEFLSFFQQLYEWTISQDYFNANARITATVPGVLDLEWVSDENESATDDCGAGLTRCFFVLADEKDPASPIESTHSIEYLSSPYEIEISDNENDPNEPDYNFQVKVVFSEEFSFEVKDYSHFSQEALYLARNELLQVLHQGVMFYPSGEASQIYRVLEEQLGSSVFFHSYLTPYWGVYNTNVEFEHLGERNILGSIQGVLSLVSERFIRAPDTR